MEEGQKSSETHNQPNGTPESLGAVSIAGTEAELNQTADVPPVQTVSWGRPISPPYNSDRGIATVGFTSNEVRQILGQE